MIRVAVAGAGGRMGKALVAAVTRTDRLSLGAAFGRNDDIDAALAAADVLIDFTVPSTLEKHARACIDGNKPWVLGTTGFNDLHRKMIDAAAKRVPVVQSYNMSLGVNLLAGMVRRAAALLDADFDAEVLEIHHKHKIDAPSGTAYMLARAIADGRGVDAATHIDVDRSGARKAGRIGMASLRGGAVVGEHSVFFIGEAERLEFKHVADDRNVFADGALYAARRIMHLPPGLYDMVEVLGLQ